VFGLLRSRAATTAPDGDTIAQAGFDRGAPAGRRGYGVITTQARLPTVEAAAMAAGKSASA
jgi:hypothetical protein